jgi:hypothetical protein
MVKGWYRDVKWRLAVPRHVLSFVPHVRVARSIIEKPRPKFNLTVSLDQRVAIFPLLQRKQVR